MSGLLVDYCLPTITSSRTELHLQWTLCGIPLHNSLNYLIEFLEYLEVNHSSLNSKLISFYRYLQELWRSSNQLALPQPHHWDLHWLSEWKNYHPLPFLHSTTSPRVSRILAFRSAHLCSFATMQRYEKRASNEKDIIYLNRLWSIQVGITNRNFEKSESLPSICREADGSNALIYNELTKLTWFPCS